MRRRRVLSLRRREKSACNTRCTSICSECYISSLREERGGDSRKAVCGAALEAAVTYDAGRDGGNERDSRSVPEVKMKQEFGSEMVGGGLCVHV